MAAKHIANLEPVRRTAMLVAQAASLETLPLPASRKMQFYHYVSLAICAP